MDVKQSKNTTQPLQQGEVDGFIISVRDTWFIIIVSLCFFSLSIYILYCMCTIYVPIQRKHKRGHVFKIYFLTLLLMWWLSKKHIIMIYLYSSITRKCCCLYNPLHVLGLILGSPAFKDSAIINIPDIVFSIHIFLWKNDINGGKII